MSRFISPQSPNRFSPACHPERSEAAITMTASARRAGFFAALSMTVAGALCSLGLGTAAALAAAELPAPGHPLAGTWHFDAARSTELSPWRDYVFTLTITGDRVTIARQFSSGRRQFADSQTIDLSRPDNIVPVTLWPDNRHLGAYIGGDRTKRVRGEWLDAGRILRLSTDLVLSTQQGDRAVNILSDYKVSANGARLTLTEIRSTRNRPVVYSFTRAAAASK